MPQLALWQLRSCILHKSSLTALRCGELQHWECVDAFELHITYLAGVLFSVVILRINVTVNWTKFCSDINSDRGITNRKHVDQLRQHYGYLTERMDSKHSGLLEALLACRVINMEEKGELEAIDSPVRRTESLLILLFRKTPEQFKDFLSALDQTNQRHVANMITTGSENGSALDQYNSNNNNGEITSFNRNNDKSIIDETTSGGSAAGKMEHRLANLRDQSNKIEQQPKTQQQTAFGNVRPMCESFYGMDHG